MRHVLSVGVAGIAVSVGAQSSAEPRDAPDYHLIMPTCEALVAPSYPVDESVDPIRTSDFEGLYSACERTGKRRLRCEVLFKEKGAKPAVVNYLIDAELPTMWVWRTDNWSDYLVINPARGTAVLTVRMLDEKFVATKLCYGHFLTHTEYELLQKR